MTVINYLKSTNKVSTIGLWGRSMGAVTSIGVADKCNDNQGIQAMVGDSAFSSGNNLIQDFVNRYCSIIPELGINTLKSMVRNTVMEKAGFDLEKIEPIDYVGKLSNVSALFCHGIDDKFILGNNTKELYNAYSGKKEGVMFDGNHNSKRPYRIGQLITLFFYDKLQVDDTEKEFEESIYSNVKTIENDKMINENITEEDEMCEMEGVENEDFLLSSKIISSSERNLKASLTTSETLRQRSIG